MLLFSSSVVQGISSEEVVFESIRSEAVFVRVLLVQVNTFSSLLAKSVVLATEGTTARGEGRFTAVPVIGDDQETARFQSMVGLRWHSWVLIRQNNVGALPLSYGHVCVQRMAFFSMRVLWGRNTVRLGLQSAPFGLQKEGNVDMPGGLRIITRRESVFICLVG